MSNCCRTAATFLMVCCIVVSCAKAQFRGFPSEIQALFDSGDYVVTSWDTLGLGIDGFSPWVGSYFLYLDLTQSQPEQRVIVRYNIGGPSVFSEMYGGNPADEIPLTGIVHLDAQYEYSGTAFDFKLYLENMDQADELITSIFPHESIRLIYRNTNALLSGEGSYRCVIDDKGCDPFDLESPDPPQFCLACFCEIGATLWMSRIEYVQNNPGIYQIEIDPIAFGQTEFPPVYEQHQGWPGFDGSYNGDDEEQWLFQRFELAPVLPGDINRDGAVNLLDVNPFIELINSDNYRFEADLNGDSQINIIDIPLFIDILVP